MFKIDKDTLQISITRGDVASIEVKANLKGDNAYVFNEGDIVRLNVFKARDCNCSVLSKEVRVEEETTSVLIQLESDDTRFTNLINRPIDYWYEIELNPYTTPQTIIGYDEKGAKIFRLYPEGSDKQ